MKLINKETLYTIQLTEREIDLIVSALNEHDQEDVEIGNEEVDLMECLANLI